LNFDYSPFRPQTGHRFFEFHSADDFSSLTVATMVENENKVLNFENLLPEMFDI
jgi:hypothetical protein